MAGHPNTGFVIALDEDGRMEWPLRQANGKRSYDVTNDAVRVTLQTLAERGPIEDKSGRATLVLHKRASRRSKHIRQLAMNAYTMKLKDMEDHGLITREVRGKRTRSIALAIDPDTFPAEWAADDPRSAYRAAVEAAAPEREHVEDTAPPESPPPESPPVPEVIVLDTSPANDDINYDALAAALLAQCIDAATRNGQDGEQDRDRHSYLSAQLVNAHTQLEKAQQRVRALEQDVEVLRGRVMSMRVDRDEEKRLREGVEANLSRVVQQLRANGSAAFQLDDHQRRALSKLISEIPVSPHTQRNVG